MKRIILGLALLCAVRCSAQVAMMKLDDISGDQLVCVTNWGPYVTSSIAGMQNVIANMASTQYVASVLSPLTRRVSGLEVHTNNADIHLTAEQRQRIEAAVTNETDAVALAALSGHALRSDNPHSVTASQIGAVSTNDARYKAAITNESTTLAQAAARGGFAGTEDIRVTRVAINDSDNLFTFDSDGLYMANTYDAAGLSPDGLVLNFLRADGYRTWEIRDNYLYYTHTNSVVRWVFERQAGTYTVAATSDLDSHSAATNPHPQYATTQQLAQLGSSGLTTNDVDARVALGVATLPLPGGNVINWPYYTPFSSIITPASGTATVSVAVGSQPSLTITAPTVIQLDPTGFPTTGVCRVSLNFYSGTNAVTFATNVVTYATIPTVSTSCWNTVLFRRTANCIWKGAGL